MSTHDARPSDADRLLPRRVALQSRGRRAHRASWQAADIQRSRADATAPCMSRHRWRHARPTSGIPPTGSHQCRDRNAAGESQQVHVRAREQHVPSRQAVASRCCVPVRLRVRPLDPRRRRGSARRAGAAGDPDVPWLRRPCAGHRRHRWSADGPLGQDVSQSAAYRRRDQVDRIRRHPSAQAAATDPHRRDHPLLRVVQRGDRQDVRAHGGVRSPQGGDDDRSRDPAAPERDPGPEAPPASTGTGSPAWRTSCVRTARASTTSGASA